MLCQLLVSAAEVSSVHGIFHKMMWFSPFFLLLSTRSAEGNPCGKGCCKQSFRIYPHDQEKTDGDAPYLGVILKKPKSFATAVFTDADAFVVDFPKDASADQKGILMGTSIVLNAVFYEGGGD